MPSKRPQAIFCSPTVIYEDPEAAAAELAKRWRAMGIEQHVITKHAQSIYPAYQPPPKPQKPKPPKRRQYHPGYRPHNFKDLTGLVFGRWKVLRLADSKNARNWKWVCQCQCGNEGIVIGNNLRRRHSLQCKPCASKAKQLIRWALYREHKQSHAKLHELAAKLALKRSEEGKV